MRPFLLTLMLAGCDTPREPDADWPWEDDAAVLPGEAADDDANGPPRRTRLWYTCGDPVCTGYAGPQPGVPLCGNHAEGDRCPSRFAGRVCDAGDGCNRELECRRDPDPGTCPRSRKAVKDEIHYLTAPERDAAATQLRSMKLARWRYKGALDDGRTHLGFLIDDAPESAAVAADGEHVDLYGYTSLAVATIQQQAEQLSAQQAQIDAQQAQIDALKAAVESLKRR